MLDSQKKIIFSGIQPTSTPHLGNYLGALKNWKSLQDEFECIFCIVDMHAITVKRDPSYFRQKNKELIALLLAIGLDPQKCTIYFQSHIPSHAELMWILSCFTYEGELRRMTQFKDKSIKNSDNINAGLFLYPVLMAADILVHNADLVPVGEDQRQHLELTRDLAIRFNNIYGNIFKVPDPYIKKIGSKIMGLSSPTKKMSKSDSESENNLIYLLDNPDTIIKKIKRATTDSYNKVEYSKQQSGISNLLEIYSALNNISIQDCEKLFCNSNYGDFKSAVAESIVKELVPIQQKYNDINLNKDYVDKVLKDSTDKAYFMSKKNISKIYKKIGFYPK